MQEMAITSEVHERDDITILKLRCQENQNHIMNDIREMTSNSALGQSKMISVLISFGVGATFGLIVAVVGPGGPGSKAAAFLLVTLILGGVMLPITLLQQKMRSVSMDRMRTTMSTLDGIFRVEGKGQAIECPLDQCVWRSCNPAGETLFSNGQSLTSNASILIETPSTSVTFSRSREGIVAVGFSPEMGAAWREILQESGAKEVARQDEFVPKRGPGPIAQTLITLIAIPTCFIGTALLGAGVTSLLDAMGVSPDIGHTIGMLIFVPGCIFAIIYAITLPLEWNGVKATSNYGKGLVWPPHLLAIYMTVIIGLFVGVPMAMIETEGPIGTTLRAKFLSVLLVLIVSWIVGLDLGRRLKRMGRLTDDKKSKRTSVE